MSLSAMSSLLFILLTIIGATTSYPTSELTSVELSFKTLESGESSGEVINQCCQRESNFVSIGHGIGEGDLRIDVGRCRQKCMLPIVTPLKREEFDRYLKKFPDMDPIQIFLNLQTKNSISADRSTSVENIHETNNFYRSQNRNAHLESTSCLQSICLPSSVKRESFYDLSGEVKEIDVIEACNCANLPQQGCQKVASPVRILVDTPYEKEVDVGQCLGRCDDDSAEQCLSCRAVRNRTIATEGPNGAYCLSVIDECQCVGGCYRVRQFLKVYDYTQVFEATAPPMNSPGNETINNLNSVIARGNNRTIDGALDIQASPNDISLQPLTKVIDIGRCSGSCSDVSVTSKCLLWSSSNNGTCLSFLSGGRSKCSATKFVSHSYTDKDGKKHTVVSVSGCSCR